MSKGNFLHGKPRTAEFLHMTALTAGMLLGFYYLCDGVIVRYRDVLAGCLTGYGLFVVALSPTLFREWMRGHQ